jgi:hypothetical protein
VLSDKEERDKRSAVVRMQAGYAIVDERWRRLDNVFWGDDHRVLITEEVLKVSMSASNHEK